VLCAHGLAERGFGADDVPVTPDSRSTRAGSLDPTGILLVGTDEQVQARPTSEAIANAFDEALRFAMAHPDDIGLAWIDPSTGELVLSAVAGKGRALIEAEAATIAAPHRIRDVAHSYAELQKIQDDVTFLATEGVVDAQLIYQTLPDQRDNRALITISRMSRPLLEELVSRFGADAIAVRVDPNHCCPAG
jgi:hypothetical protein